MKTAKVNVWARQVNFKPHSISDVWWKYSFPTKVQGKLLGFLNDWNIRGQCSYFDVITSKRKKAFSKGISKFQHIQVCGELEQKNTDIWNTSPLAASDEFLSQTRKKASSWTVLLNKELQGPGSECKIIS